MTQELIKEKQSRITKVLKIYVDKDGNGTYDMLSPTLLLTYQVIPKNNGEIVRENIRIQNKSVSERYYGKTPVLFIQNDNAQDLEQLNLANLINTALDDVDKVMYERSIKREIKKALGGKNVRFRKDVEYGEYAEKVVLKRPHINYRPYTTKIFKDVADSIVNKSLKEKVE